jgi:hypothetical protein
VLLLLQMRGKLTPTRTADLLAVAFSAFTKGDAIYNATFHNIMDLFSRPSAQRSAAAQLPAAAVWALLLHVVQLYARHSQGAAGSLSAGFVRFLSELPGAAQLPAATVVESVQQLLQTEENITPLLVNRLLWKLSSVQLTAEQVKGLLSPLQGPSAGVSTLAYSGRVEREGPTVTVWLARQPGAAAAAAELGLTAADVQDPDAAALLFGGQAAGAADVI